MGANTLQAKDLRIGNYALKGLRSGNGRKLSYKLYMDDIVRIDANTGGFIYEPIPLSEEWLLKFGFDNVNNGLSIKCQYNYLDYDNETGLFLVENLEVLTKTILDLSSIKYVHQLQNLYHSLTGEELTIKE